MPTRKPLAPTVSEPAMIRWPKFTAVKVATRTHVFIAHLGPNFHQLPSIEKIEVYRIGRDHYTETFVGYADREHLAQLAAPLINAAHKALRAEWYEQRRHDAETRKQLCAAAI